MLSLGCDIDPMLILIISKALALAASRDIETILVTPQAWQKGLELPKDKQERKKELKSIATKGSGLKATLKTADAICIAMYGMNNV